MNFKKILSGILSAALLFTGVGGAVLADTASPSELFCAMFDFGGGKTAEGYISVTPADTYSEETGYGITDTEFLKTGGKDSSEPLKDYVVTSDAAKGICFTVDVPDGNYTVSVVTGGDTQTTANIYINGGERVRTYTLKENEYQNNTQPVIPKDGKITIQVLGENAKVNAVEITQMKNRTEKGEKPTIYIAGDSTAQTYEQAANYPQFGWGQVISDYFDGSVNIENRSMAGRSSKSYDNDGRLDQILTELKPGDYVFIQFGHNDGSSKPERYISIDDFKTLLKTKYIGETIKRGGIPVILTPTPHYSPDENGNFAQTIIDYSDAAREVASSEAIALIDIHADGVARWNALGADKVKTFYFINEQGESVKYPEGTDDHTHFKEAGAREIARLVADGIKSEIPALSKAVYAGTQQRIFSDLTNHWAKENIEKIAATSIVKGISNTEFAPEQTVTRAEFLSMVMRATDINGKAYRETDCYDVSKEDWFRFYVQGAKDKALLPHDFLTDNKFNGNQTITREEMAVLAVNALTYTGKAYSQTKNIPAFDDMHQISSYAKPAVVTACTAGLMNGMNDNKFAPAETATRAQAAVVISRLYDFINE